MSTSEKPAMNTPDAPKTTTVAMNKTKDEWLKQLGPAKYRILREAGTERAFSHEFWKKEASDGSYRCAGCGTKLFEGTSKFVSECGWPAFDKAVPGTIKYVEDRSYGMVRTEVRCTACDGHLGHVFDDGPTATGQRYCINGLSIDYAEKSAQAEAPAASPQTASPKPAP
jgi:peptide-methionine (R)-S-oxide reductase